MSLRRAVATVCLLLLGLVGARATTDEEAKAAYRPLLTQVQAERLRTDIRAMAAFGSRIAGSSGEAKTFDYVEARLRALGGRNVRRTPFTVTVPNPDSTGTIQIGRTRTTVYPLWPNLVRTSTCDVAGRVLYGGDGSLEAFRGKEVKGAIVLLEMGGGANWKNAAKLGAAAAVFLQPDEIARPDAESKYSAVPVDFPRFYLPLRGAGPLLLAARNASSAHLVCRQDWQRRESRNLFVEFPGTDAKGELIELTADADSMSVVPGLSPGGEALAGPAVLLEAARIYATRPHKRPIRFALLGAHGLALQGSREYTQRAVSGKEKPPFLSINLDISSGSRALGGFERAWFYEYRDDTQARLTNLSRVFRHHAEVLAALENVPPRMVLTDAANNGDDRTWRNNVPGKFALDCEPMIAAGLNAITLFTIEDGREHVDTPFDDPAKLNFANIGWQAKTVMVLLERALNDTSDRNELSPYRLPLNAPTPTAMGLVGGFATMKGRVVEYDPNRSFVPDTPVANTLVVDLPPQKTTMGVRNEMMQMTGPDARYELVGHLPSTGWAVGKHFVRLQAFRIDPPSGRIDYAASWGVYGDGTYPIEFNLKTGLRDSPLVVFPCEPLSLYDMVDPQSLTALPWAGVLDAETGSRPQDYGEYDPIFDNRLTAEVEDSQAIFLPKGQRYMLLGGMGESDIRLALTHSSLGNEKGTGYVLPPGDGTFDALPLHVAKDLAAINATRIARFAKYRIISPGVADLQRDAESEIAEADKARADRDWAAADRHARAAWGYALRAHPVIQGTTNDVVNGVVFYLFLLIPFSYFIERLLVGSQLLTRQLLGSVGIFVGAFLVLRLIHPAFEIVSNPLMIFIAFVMGTLSLVVVSFVLGKFEQSLKAVRQAQSGVHEVDVKRSSVAMAAFNLGVSNMRRRKARTILTTMTLVVMTFIVLSFTSIVSELQLTEYPSNNPARYSGMLLRGPGLEPMQLATYRALQNEFSGRGTVVRRAMYYGAEPGENSLLQLQRADQAVQVRAMLGMDADETKVLRPQEALLPGGRWFRPGEQDAMILPTPLAAQLKIDPSAVGKAKVNFSGVNYTVVGMVDPGIIRAITDLDGDGIMPADFSLSDKYQKGSNSSTQAFRKYLRLDPATVFILPAETAMGLGADLRTLAVRFDDPSRTRQSLDSLMPRLRMNLYASVPAKGGLEVRQFSVLQGSKGAGIGIVLIQLLIASIFVMNTMVASVYERTKEIAIFSSIGLAPNHIGMLFFAESLVYGILGAVIGYFAAQGSAKIIVGTGALKGLTLNFSSTSAVLSAGIVMAVVLLSTIYPARKAAQIAAPARNDEVFEAEPEGDAWVLPLPFSIGASEAGPLVRFLAEWLQAYEEYTIGDFVTSDTAFEESSGPAYAVSATAWLAPYDLGISQHLRLEARPGAAPGIYALELTLHRLAGDPENWPTVNQRFLANLRKQFLTWRTLKKDERARYDLASTSGPR